MRIGVLSEGHADRAVITNILTGLIDIDRSAISSIRPIYNYDETDKAALPPETFSNWSLVKKECQSREAIDEFLLLEGNDFIVIHLDTAEAELYGVKRPDKRSPSYCSDLRGLVIEKINEWFQEDLSTSILYAIAIEETEAWILPIYEPRISSTSADPKQKLSRILAKKGISSTSDYSNFLEISKNLSKAKVIKKEKYLSYNESLKAFFDEVEDKVGNSN